MCIRNVSERSVFRQTSCREIFIFTHSGTARGDKTDPGDQKQTRFEKRSASGHATDQNPFLSALPDRKYHAIESAVQSAVHSASS